MLRKIFVVMVAFAAYWVCFPANDWQTTMPFMLRADAQTPPTVSPPCGTPAWTASPGAPVNAQNLNAEIYHLEACAGNAAAQPTTSPPIVASGSPPVFTITTGNCLAITAGVLAYNCATPAVLVAGPCTSPYPTTSATVTGVAIGISTGAGCGGGGTVGGVVGGTCIGVTPTASPTGGVVVSYSGCPTPVPTPTGATVVTYVTPNPFESAVLARTDVTHFWELHDLNATGGNSPAPCSTGVGAIADAIGGGATGNPSPVPLTVVTEAPAPAPWCQFPNIIPNQGTFNAASYGSIVFCFNIAEYSCNNTLAGAGSYIALPASVQTASFASTPYTVCGIIGAMPSTRDEIWFGRDPQDSLQLDVTGQASGATQWDMQLNLGANNQFSYVGPAFACYTNSGSTSTFYVNGEPMATTATVPSTAPTGAGGIGAGVGGASPFVGRLNDIFYANTAWSQALIQYFYTLTGL